MIATGGAEGTRTVDDVSDRLGQAAAQIIDLAVEEQDLAPAAPRPASPEQEAAVPRPPPLSVTNRTPCRAPGTPE